MNRLIVILGGGLGNRLPPLCSALRLADLNNRELFAVWGRQREFLLQPTDIFGGILPFNLGAPPDMISAARYPFDVGPTAVRYPEYDAELRPVGPVRIGNVAPETDIFLVCHHFVANHLDQRSLDYEARDPFMADVGRYFKRIPLNPYVAGRIAEFQSKIDYSRTLGVHIRRGTKNSIHSDADAGRDWWHIEAYVRSIEIILKAKPYLNRLYVASNDEDSREYICSRFPEISIINKLAGDGWATFEYQQEAFVEMNVLGRCCTILRQPWTTFSMFASVIDCTHLVTMTNFDGATYEPVLKWCDWARERDTEGTT